MACGRARSRVAGAADRLRQPVEQNARCCGPSAFGLVQRLVGSREKSATCSKLMRAPMSHQSWL